jgi:hypothetical protein
VGDGRLSKVVICKHEIKNRAYDALSFNIVGEDENDPITTEMDFEGVLVDKMGWNTLQMNTLSHMKKSSSLSISLPFKA